MIGLAWTFGCREPGGGAVQRRTEAEAAEAAPKDEEVRIALGSVQVETPGEGGPAWRLQGSAPGLGVSGEELKSAVLKDVRGELVRQGKTVSRVEGSEARIDHVRRRLVLTGGVRVASLDQGLILRADRIDYSDGGRFIEARGGVTLTGRGYRLGPAPALRATPDLKRVGTEDRLR